MRSTSNQKMIFESAQFGDIKIENTQKDWIEFIAVLQEADAPNRNGRVYPKAVLEKALEAPNIKERIATGTFFGESGHPSDPSLARQMTVDLRNVAFIIKEFWWEGNLLKGRIQTANTAAGHDMKGLIEQGCRVAFSLRAQGQVHKNPLTGLVEVDNGLQIVGYDWVQVPSHSKAFLERLCESTIYSMYKATKEKLNNRILTESEEEFLNGALVDLNTEDDPKELDYTKNYTTKFKKVEDMYIPEEGDEVVSMDDKTVLIKNESLNVIKKVLTEDFLVKDFRRNLTEMFGGDRERERELTRR